MDLPGHKKTLAPGMSQPIVAGEEYSIVDDTGAELELVGKIDPNTIAFLRAFDLWLTLDQRLGMTNDATKAARFTLTEKWNGLGDHVKRELITL